MLINVTKTIVLYLLIVNNAYPDLSYKRMNEANTTPPVDKTDKQKESDNSFCSINQHNILSNIFFI